MKKSLLSILAIIASLGCVCQVDNNKLLRALMNDSDFCKHVIPCKKCDTIYVIDTLGYFTHDQYLMKNIVVTKKYIKGIYIPKNDSDLIKWDCSNLFITKISQNKNYFRINYFHTPTNGIGYIEYQFKGDKLIKVKAQYGQL